ncbi:MAG TPA: aminotransferase class I/II-fold pyridoxal phosphate-dependent enzyme [Streptosporangiaceae bacterium]|jgi:cystathionine beta-lyase
MTGLLTAYDLAELRGRRSVKWSEYPADVLPMRIAEMDTPLAAYTAFAAGRYAWHPDPAAMRLVPDVTAGITEALRLVTAPGARAYVLCSPHNPTGAAFGRDDLLAIAALADRYDVRVIADDIPAPLTYPGRRHIPFASLDAPAAARSFVIASASKAWNLAGLKAALVVPGAEAQGDAAAIHEEIGEGAGLFGVIASEAAFTHGGPWLAELLAELDANRRLLADLLRAHLPGIVCHAPQAVDHMAHRTRPHGIKPPPGTSGARATAQPVRGASGVLAAGCREPGQQGGEVVQAGGLVVDRGVAGLEGAVGRGQAAVRVGEAVVGGAAPGALLGQLVRGGTQPLGRTRRLGTRRVALLDHRGRTGAPLLDRLRRTNAAFLNGRGRTGAGLLDLVRQRAGALLGRGLRGAVVGLGAS